jgi:hypothetical protein
MIAALKNFKYNCNINEDEKLNNDISTNICNTNFKQNRYNLINRKNKEMQIKTNDYWEENIKKFNEYLKSDGLYVKDVGSDGNCLFRSISDQLYGNENKHEKIR